MAYMIAGEKQPLIYCANVRTGSTAIAQTILNMGGLANGYHHMPPMYVPPFALCFQVVRHHADALYSYWRSRSHTYSFETWLEIVFSGVHTYFGNSMLYDRFPIADRKLRYENLEAEFQTLCEEVGVEPIPIIRIPSKRLLEETWQTAIKPATLDLIFDQYREEMEELGYGRSSTQQP